MAKVLKTTLVITLVTWVAMWTMVYGVATPIAGESMMMVAVGVAFGMAVFTGLIVFAMLSFRLLRQAAVQAPARSAAQSGEPGPPAPPDYGGFVRDLAMAIACGLVVGLAVYVVMSQVVSEPPAARAHEPQPARIVPGIAGVLVFLAVFFRRLVMHMFPTPKVPEARAIARRPAR